MTRWKHGRPTLGHLLCVCALAACDSTPVEPPPPVPTTVTLEPRAARLDALGDTAQLTVSVRDQSGQLMAGVALSWVSSDTVVATVSANGLVTSVANGVARITASAGMASGSADVTVEQAVVAVEVTPTPDTLVAFGDTVRLSAAAFDANSHVVAGTEFAWAAVDESVATVDAAGLVTAVGNGATEVTATVGSVDGSARVTVEQAVAAVEVTPPPDTLVAFGDTVRLSAEGVDANGHLVAGAEFAWAAADESVATVDAAGLVTAVGNGATEITATAGSVDGTALVTIEQQVAAVDVTPAPDALVAFGDTVRLSAAAFDANGHLVDAAEFGWASDDESVATVDAAGLVTAAGNGATEVTARAGSIDGSARVTVEQRVAAIHVAPAPRALAAFGDTVRLSAEALDPNGHLVADTEFDWAAGNGSVATVDAAGLVTAVGNGATEITASARSIAGSVRVIVEQQVADVDVTPAQDTLAAFGDTVRLSAEAFDANGHLVAGAELAWAAVDESVATVNAAGLVTAVGNGTTEITVTGSSVTGSTRVTVEQVVTTVNVKPASGDLVALGETVRLLAEAFDANGHAVASAGLAWAAVDESVATVDAAGLVTAVGNGVTEVTATTGSVTGRARISVRQIAVAADVTPAAEVLVALGDTIRLSAEALDANGHAVAGTEFTWVAGNKSIATVDGAGLVTAVGGGATEVTATAGSVIARARITVRQIAVAVDVTPAVEVLAIGESIRFVAEAFDANGYLIAGADYAWGSDDESVATVDDDGVVTAVGDGATEVTATAGSVSGRARVTVVQIVAVDVKPAANALSIGDTVRLSAEAFDADGHVLAGAEYAWASDDESVAKVDNEGLVTAVGDGTTEVTATTGSVTGWAEITVGQHVTTVEVTPTANALSIGATVRLSAEAFDGNGQLVAGTVFTWATGDESVATVDDAGLVTAVGEGATEVTAATGSVTGRAQITVGSVGNEPFRIHVHYLGNVPDLIRQEMDAAAAQWERWLAPTPAAPFIFSQDVVLSMNTDLPERGFHVRFDAGAQLAPGLHLWVTTGTDIGAWGWVVDGFWAHSVGRSDVPTPPWALIWFNWQEISSRLQNPSVRRELVAETAVHEIGHAVGIGTSPRWFQYRVTPDSTKPWDRFLTDPAAIAGFDNMGGNNYPYRKIPLSEDGAHWDGCAGINDYLGTHGGPDNAITEVTFAALADGFEYVPELVPHRALDSTKWNWGPGRCVDGRWGGPSPSPDAAASWGLGFEGDVIIDPRARRYRQDSVEQRSRGNDGGQLRSRSIETPGPVPPIDPAAPERRNTDPRQPMPDQVHPWIRRHAHPMQGR